jgi:1-acyl-sn-glycerol-3-phosphate acyltransferase
MKFILGFIFTPVFYLYYSLILLLFHPLMVAALFFFGDPARRKVVDLLNYSLVKGLYLLGCKVSFIGFEKIPANRPLIIVSNHQSMFDIPAIGYGFRKYYTKFVSKIELSKYFPSISHNLKHGKSALIDRKNKTQAVKEIFNLGKLIRENNYAACIFPEGTRSKTGQVKKFKPAGISTLLLAAPSAVIVPFVIDGHSQLTENGIFPLKFGQKITYTVLDTVEPANRNIDDLVENIQIAIKKALKQAY